MSFLEDLDPLIAATADRIVYICRKGVINHNQAYWRLNDLLLQGRRGLSDRELLQLDRDIRSLLDGRPSPAHRSESTIIAARVPRRVVDRIDDFASAYLLTRSQCVGLALDLVFGQEWQLNGNWRRNRGSDIEALGMGRKRCAICSNGWSVDPRADELRLDGAGARGQTRVALGYPHKRRSL